MCRPRNEPNAEPANVTTSTALWCTRKIGNARAFSARASGRRARDAGRTSSTRPTCASARASAAADGGDRFDSAAPGTPTALTGYPAASSDANATPPPTANAAPHERR
ncbi:hypothetical protein EDD40_5708 [Saccharothrix texasensis]|uniref:Uncharacterized protein n=1 Tax=Saccharothrix texasensis TaxID=103734 RepID=A0A3N1HCS2_9PSEU|nr:hypothetical protein [Saccharothrix texasensis]ROP40300.1 hypothetical protein EDD40_5708 [Saccharothrix texasensis]